MASKHFKKNLSRLAPKETWNCRLLYCAISLIMLALTTCPAFAQVCNTVYGSITVNPNLVLLAEPGPMNGDILTNGNLQINLGIGYLNTQGTENSGFGPGVSIFSDGTPSEKEPYRQSTNDPNVFNYVYPDGSKEVYTGILLSSLTDVLGKTTTITYRPGTTIPTSITGPDGASTTFEVTDVGVDYPRITKVSYASGDYVTCNYSGGYLSGIVGKDGSALFTLERDSSAWGPVVSVITPDGRTNIFYEKKDRNSAAAVVKIIYPDKSGMTYSRSRIVRGTGRTQTTLDTVTATPNENCGFRVGMRTAYVYDGVWNRLMSVWRDSTQGYKNVLSWSYDTFGRVTVEDDQDSLTLTRYSYEGTGHLPKTVTKTVPTANTTDIPSGLVQVKSDYTYSADWKVLSIKNTYTPVTKGSSASRPTTPIGTTEERYLYDSSGRLTKVTSLGNDQETSSTSYTYTGNSRLPSSSSATETSQINVSSRGVVTKVIQPSGLPTEFKTTATSSIRKSMGFTESIAINRGASGDKTYTVTDSNSTTVASRNSSSRTVRGGMTLRSSTSSSDRSTTTTNTCSSNVDGCTETITCTPDPSNPDSCTLTTTQNCQLACNPRAPCTVCGAPTGCGQEVCTTGSCPNSGESCQNGRCVCIPNCTGRTCGSNSCGGQCGQCAQEQTCNNSGQCVARPPPSPTPRPRPRPPQPPSPPQQRCNCNGRSCGPNTCGTGTCGTCGSGQTCTAGGQCVTTECRYEGQSCGGASGSCCGNGVCSGGVCNPPPNPGWCTPGDPRFGGGNFCNGSDGYAPVVTGTTCTCVKR